MTAARERVRRARSSAWAYLAGACLLSAAYVPAPAVAKTAIFLLVAFATTVLVCRAPRRWQCGRDAWRPMSAATMLFAVGAVTRAVAATGSALPTWSADIPTLLGYASLGICLLRLLRTRSAGQDSATLTDAVLVGLAGLVGGWTFLVEPTLANPALGRGVEHLISAVYPPIDALLITFAVGIALTGRRSVSVQLLLMMCVTMLVGDIGYATALAGLSHLVGPVLDTPFLLSYGALGAAALHPSFRDLTTPQPVVVQPLRRARLVIVGLAVMMPSVVLLVRAPASLGNRIVLSVGTFLLIVVVLRRAVIAIRAHARSESMLAQRATVDELTGLPNRARLLERLGQDVADAEADAEPLGVLLVDLDRFKVVNDCYGHPVGDELLRAVSQRLTTLVDGHDYVARSGGDEFVIVVHGDHGTPHEYAERVHVAFAVPFSLAVADVVVSPSIGVSLAAPGAAASAQTLVRDADTAMYRAKDAGRGRTVTFDDGMRAAVVRRVQVEQALHRALARPGGFEVHYQPIVTLASGALEGFEALIRMPGSGLGPDEFIPVAEDSGLIAQLGTYVLRESVRAVAHWRALGATEVFVAVNVSARQLTDPALVNTVIEVLHEHEVPAAALHLEVTESSLMDDVEAAQRTLTALTSAGIAVAVDDFGTGYSSLAYLHRFPVSTVKVDRGFVQTVASSGKVGPDDGALVRAIVAMAHALGMSIVAEGVETVQQQNRLVAFGCESGQGWLFGKPVGQRDADELVRCSLSPHVAAG